MAVQAGLTAFQANAFQLDAFQILDDSLSDGGGDYSSYSQRKESRKKKKSKKERERLLDNALAKAFEPKRASIVDRMPWLAEPIPEAILLEQPQFNPRLAALHGQARRIEDQLAQLQFNRAQEEADIELLLMAL